MSDLWRPTRRLAMLAPLAGVACATAGKAGGDGKPADIAFDNVTTPSESVHSGVSSPDGQQRLTVRLCRYPEMGLAWVWMHARTPQGFFSYVDHMAPCERTATPEGGESASYSDSAGTLVFERKGMVDKPAAAHVRGACRARGTATSRFGPGSHPMSVEIDFQPKRLFSGLNRGRTEVFGHSRAVLTIDGRALTIEGPAQFHEQRQTTPRFTAAFAYSTLWAEDAASTLLLTKNRRNGYLIEGDVSTEVDGIELAPPGPERRLKVYLKDGRSLDGRITLVQAFSIPIVGQDWRGHMVTVELGGRRYFGHSNDFLPDQLPYAAS